MIEKICENCGKPLMRESKRVPTCLANEERRKELEERYKEE